MEQSEAFKEAVEAIKAMETQLSLCDSYTSTWEHSLAEAELQIEEYFEKMMNALAARKATLEREIAQQNDMRRAIVEEHRKRLKVSIEGCTATMKGAAVLHSVNPNDAKTILKGVTNTTVPTIEESRLVVELSPTLVDVIKDIGKVKIDHKEIEAKTWDIVRINYPTGMCFNIHDNCFYICGIDGMHKMTLQGEISTFANPDGCFYKIIYNSVQKSFFAVSILSAIYEVSANGEVSLLAGREDTSGNKDAVGSKATFDSPSGLAYDKQTGNLYVSDDESNRIRKITAKGEVTTIVGGFFGSPLNDPSGICFDEQDNSLIVCDFGNNRLVRVKLDGKVSTLCSVACPFSVAMKGEDIYVTSTSQLFRVSRTQGGVWTTTAVAQFKTSALSVVIVIHESSCFVADFSNNEIYRIPV